MAESISEGTLKSWSKQVGDTVAADEEVATIETDKVHSKSNVTGFKERFDGSVDRRDGQCAEIREDCAVAGE